MQKHYAVQAYHNKSEQAFALLWRGTGKSRDLKALIDALPQRFGPLHVFQEKAVLLHAGHIEGVGHTTHLQGISQHSDRLMTDTQMFICPMFHPATNCFAD